MSYSPRVSARALVALLVFAIVLGLAPSGGASGGGGRDCPDSLSEYNAALVMFDLDITGEAGTAMASFELDLPDGCKIPLALAVYATSGATFASSFPQMDHASVKGEFGDGSHKLGPLTMPGCYYQVDFVFGDLLTAKQLNEGARYGNRKIGWDNGGSRVCEPLPCPGGLQGEAAREGNLLSWQAAPGATKYNVYRDSGAGFALIGMTASTSFLDEDVEDGVSYEYRVTSSNARGDFESEDCETITLTAVPFFPAAIGLIIGAFAAVAAIAVFSRK